MRTTRFAIAPLVAALSLLPAGLAAMATTTTTETVTTTTTTRNIPPSRLTVTELVLSPSGTYRVLDPFTGRTIGAFDPVRKLVAGRSPTPGFLIEDAATGKVVGVIATAGTVANIAIVPVSDAFMKQITARRAAFEKAIADALKQGTITAGEAAAMCDDLARIAAVQDAEGAAGAITYAEALSLADQLDLFEQRYPAIVAAVPEPLLHTHFVITKNVVRIEDEIAFRRAALERRIDSEYDSGHLSTSQVASLKEKLNNVSARQTKYLRDGVLSDSETNTLNTLLNRVQERLDSDIAVIQDKRARMGITTQ